MFASRFGLFVCGGLSLLALRGVSTVDRHRAVSADIDVASEDVGPSRAYLPLALALAAPVAAPAPVTPAPQSTDPVATEPAPATPVPTVPAPAEPGRDGPFGRWANFSSTSPAGAIALSPDGGTLWQAGSGGAVAWNIAGGQPTVFTAVDGLLSNSQVDVAVAADGTVWFAAADGLSRRDAGGEWSTVARHDVRALDNLRAVAIAPDGAVVAGGWGGLSERGRDGTWQPVPDVPGGIVLDIAFGADGTMWVVTNQGLGRRSAGGAWRHHALDDLMMARAAAIAVDAAGTAWLGTIDLNCRSETVCGAAVRLSADGTATVWTRDDGLPMSAVTTVAAAAAGGAWFGGYDDPRSQLTADGIARIDGNGAWSLLPPTAGAALDRVLDLAEVADGTLWAATSRGVARRAADGGWRTWDTLAVDSLPIADERAGAVFDAAADAAGRLWLGTLAGLVVREADGAWRHLPVPGDDFAQHVEAVAVDADGDVWVGTRGGLFVYRPGGDPAWRRPVGDRSLVEVWIQDIAIGPDGDIWVGLPFDGLLRRPRPDADWTAFTAQRIPDEAILDIEVDGDGLAWVSSASGGVFTIDPTNEVTRLTAPNAPACQTRDIGVAPDGTVWFGPNGFGCSRISRRAPDGRWTHFSGDAANVLGSVADIAVDAAGNTWFGAMWQRGGIAVLQPDGTWQTFDTRDGLAHGIVPAIVAVPGPGGANNVWFGTHAGLTRIRMPGAPNAVANTVRP